MSYQDEQRRHQLEQERQAMLREDEQKRHQYFEEQRRDRERINTQLEQARHQYLDEEERREKERIASQYADTNLQTAEHDVLGALRMKFVVFVVLAFVGYYLLGLMGDGLAYLAASLGTSQNIITQAQYIPFYIAGAFIIGLIVYSVLKNIKRILPIAAIFLLVFGGGYIYQTYMTEQETPDIIPAQEQPGTESSFSAGSSATVTTDELNLRPQPGIGNGTVALLYAGDHVELLGEEQLVGDVTWVKVRAGTAVGWVHSDYLDLE
jgi:hypothetical protein